MPTHSAPRRRARHKRRERLVRVLFAGAAVQAAMTVAGMLAMDLARPLLLRLPLLLAAIIGLLVLLGPSWLAGLCTGWLAPGLRWWQPLTAAAPVALLCFLLAGGPVVAPLPMAMRAWLAVELAQGFVIAAWMGRRAAAPAGRRRAAPPRALTAEPLPLRRAV